MLRNVIGRVIVGVAVVVAVAASCRDSARNGGPPTGDAPVVARELPAVALPQVTTAAPVARPSPVVPEVLPADGTAEVLSAEVPAGAVSTNAVPANAVPANAVPASVPVEVPAAVPADVPTAAPVADPRREPRVGLPAGAALVVRVRRLDGSPAPGATVTLSVANRSVPKPVLVTKAADDRGRAVFDGAEFKSATGAEPAVAFAPCRMSAQFGDEIGFVIEFLGGWNAAPLDAKTVPAVTVHVRAAVRIAGKVTDEDGAPVAGAVCELMWPDGPAPGRPRSSCTGTLNRTTAATGNDGSFAFPVQPRNDTLVRGHLTITAARLEQAPGGGDVPGTGDDHVVLRMDHRLTIRGRCVDAAGRGVVAEIVTGNDRWDTRTNPDGRFAVRSVASSLRRIGVLPGELAPVGVEIPGDGGHDVELGDIVIPEGETLRARIFDAGGALVANTRVTIQGDDGTPWSREARTDLTGRLECENMPRGTVRLAVHRTACAGPYPAVAGVQTGTVDDVRVVIPRAVEFTLRFVRASDGSAARLWSAKVSVWPATDDGRSGARGGSEGVYEVGDDHLVLRVTSPGWYAAWIDTPNCLHTRIHRFEVTDDGRAQVVVPLQEYAK